MKHKILITGANGYIGQHLIKMIVQSDHQIIASSLRNNNIKEMPVRFENCNILDNSNDADLYNKLGCPAGLIHLAWQDGFSHYADSHINNLMNHFNFLKNMIDSGCKSITVMGTVHEVGYHEGRIDENTPCNPLSYYGIAKNTLRQLLFIYAKDKDVSIKWLRAFYITGDDLKNHSVFTKLIEAEKNNQATFPFTKGTNQFDFIDINELANMIVKASLQDDVTGIINVCSGEPTALKDKVEKFIQDNKFKIKIDYGAFPSRKYDSPVVYGDVSKINKIMQGSTNA